MKCVESSDKARKIAVDLIPITPGGTNGGIKPLTLNLLAALAGRGWSITCLCNQGAYAELRASLPNGIVLEPVAPGEHLDSHYDRIVERDGAFDLNFFPMQCVSIVRPDCVTVSAIMDCQFADLPDNFSAADRAERKRSFQSCVEHSDRIIAISGFTRSRIAALSDFPTQNIDVIHIAPSMPMPGTNDPFEVLTRYSVDSESYLLYPANFWPHKNHEKFVAAFALARRRTGIAAKLVLTGDANSLVGERIAALPSIRDSIILPGFIPPEDLAILTAHALAVVFPSAYEGFGMPLIEAMMLDRPVAAAWSTCIPEVTGRAALLFDHTSLDAMASAIERIVCDANLRHDLVERGQRRVAELGSHADMVEKYERVFHDAIATRPAVFTLPPGIYPDGWAGPEITFNLPPQREAFELDVGINLPKTAPFEATEVSIEIDGQSGERAIFWRGGNYRLRQGFPKQGGQLRLRAGTAFHANEWGMDSSSTRLLCCKVTHARIRLDGNARNLLRPGARHPSTVRLRDAIIAIDCAQPDGAFRLVAAAVPADDGERRDVAAEIDQSTIHLASRRSTESTVLDVLFEPLPGILRQQAGNSAELLIPLHARPLLPPAPITTHTGGSLPGFSVIVPSFNQGRFIGRTIESILAQEEICSVHVFDGGSTDETIEILTSFGDAIRWESGPDRGQAHAINKGLEAASGEFIAWINSDDIYEPNAFSHVSEIFRNKSDVSVVYGEAYHIDQTDAIIERYGAEDFELERLLQRCYICQPAAFFRRKIVERHGGLRESLHYCLDYEFWLRLACAGEIFYRTDKFLAGSRLYDQTKTIGSRPQAYFETADLMLRVMSRAGDDWIEHFANAIADHLVEYAGSSRIAAFRQAERLARQFWQRDGTEGRRNVTANAKS